MNGPVVSSHPFPRWHQNQGAENDCGPVSAAIVINALQGRAMVKAAHLSRELGQWHGLRPPGRIPRWATFPWGMVRLFRSYGLRARWRLLVGEARLRQALGRGLAVVVLVGEPLRFERGHWRGWMHYKVLYGYDEETWLFVDPAALSPITRQRTEIFMREWRNAARQIIEVWKL